MSDISQETTQRSTSNGEDALDFAGLKILRRTTAQMISSIDQTVAGQSRLDIAFCNANTLLRAVDNADYHQTLDKMTLINDGIGADLAAKILSGSSFPENLNGTDFVPALLTHSSLNLSLFLLGAKPEIVSQAAAKFQERFPQHTVAGFRDGYFTDKDLPSVFRDIEDAQPDILLVAMGNPRQEFFIHSHREHLKVPVTMGVGALFDFTAQVVKRAPHWMRATKTEWIYRLLQEPLRLAHRYTIGIGRFLWVVLRLRFQSK